MANLIFSKYKYEVDLNAIVDGAHIDRRRLVDDEEYEYNRSFMKELGYKSDSVGWIREKNISKEAFDQIINKASEKKVNIRTMCEIKVCDDDSIEWYMLQDLPFIELGEKNVPGTDKAIDTIKGYKLRENMYNTFGCCIANQKVLSVLEELGVKGYQIKWVVDNGRYDSKPYYEIYVDDIVDGYFGGLVNEDIIRNSKDEFFHSWSHFQK